MRKLANNTITWATDRFIIQNSSIQTQMLKLGSEFGELCNNLATNKAIQDDIGDCMVVCTILEAMSNRDILDTLGLIPNVHTTPMVPQAMKYLGDMMDECIKGKDFSTSLCNFVHQLEGIAHTRHTSLLEGWEIAYDDIKDRKGILNKYGNFIKSTDEIYAKTLKEMK